MKINYKDISITFKFRLEELENEDGIRQDLRNIRMKVEDRINKEIQKAGKRPNEEDKLTSANPTSAEHIK